MASTTSNFRSILVDFTSDLTNTFPEYAHLWSKWSTQSATDADIQSVFDYCLATLPERFFDILYQSEEIFKMGSTTNTFFLPNVDFRVLYNCSGISEKTQKSIWKYLQLILFTVVGEVKDKHHFGETLNMFEGIDENDLQHKMKETMESITDFFKTIIPDDEDDGGNVKVGGDAPDAWVEDVEDDDEDDDGNKKGSNDRPKGASFKNIFGNMPNMSNIQDHLKTLFEGKIGSLAKEMAEEISGEFGDILGEDVKDIKSTQDVLKKLMQNPKKIMDLMKTVGSKLDQKMKSGEISRDEIMKEAGDLFGKMKDMGGQDQFNDMFRNLAKGMGGLGGLGGLGKNTKIDTNAMNRMSKLHEQRERMRNKVQQKQAAAAMAAAANAAASANYNIATGSDPNSFKFSLNDEEAQEKSFIHPDILREMELEDEKKASAEPAPKKKNKNKKKKTIK